MYSPESIRHNKCIVRYFAMQGTISNFQDKMMSGAIAGRPVSGRLDSSAGGSIWFVLYRTDQCPIEALSRFCASIILFQISISGRKCSGV